MTITGRVTAAYEKFVAGLGYVFRPLGAAESHHDGVRIRWEMVPAAGGDAVSGGVQFLLLDAGQRVRSDYQFIDFWRGARSPGRRRRHSSMRAPMMTVRSRGRLKYSAASAVSRVVAMNSRLRHRLRPGVFPLRISMVERK